MKLKEYIKSKHFLSEQTKRGNEIHSIAFRRRLENESRTKK